MSRVEILLSRMEIFFSYKRVGYNKASRMDKGPFEKLNVQALLFNSEEYLINA